MCQALVTNELASDFFDLAFRFFHSTLKLVFFHSHDFFLITFAGKRSALV